MWPQKWYASASPGATTALTIDPPACAEQHRADLDEQPAARRAQRELLGRRRRSAMGVRLDAPLGRAEDRLELGERVERPLRQDGPRASSATA